jgi:RNA polymerase sigma-70 factor (ECF subfamily)
MVFGRVNMTPAADRPASDEGHMTDALLLKRFLAGDEDSFEELFARHYDMVYGVLYRLIGSRAEAEDLAQEVFLKLYRRRLRRGENVAGWLYRVAVNTGYNALRAAARASQREHLAERAGASHTVEEQVEQREQAHRVRLALARIRPRSAKLLLLRGMGLSYAEAADAIGVTPGSVGTLLARAQREFRKTYIDMWGEGDHETYP